MEEFTSSKQRVRWDFFYYLIFSDLGGGGGGGGTEKELW